MCHEILVSRGFRHWKVKEQRSIFSLGFAKSQKSGRRRITEDHRRGSREERSLRKIGFQRFGTREVELHVSTTPEFPKSKTPKGGSQVNRLEDTWQRLRFWGNPRKGGFRHSGYWGCEGKEFGTLDPRTFERT
jgi:hypothetical protein